jgi:hypothetical protein
VARSDEVVKKKTKTGAINVEAKHTLCVVFFFFWVVHSFYMYSNREELISLFLYSLSLLFLYLCVGHPPSQQQDEQ